MRGVLAKAVPHALNASISWCLQTRRFAMFLGLNASPISERFPRRVLKCLFLFLAYWMVLGPARTAQAQVGSTLAQLNGTVRDESGGSPGKNTITLRAVKTNQAQQPTPTPYGFYLGAQTPPPPIQLII